MNLSGKRYLPYSVKIIAQEAGSTRFVPSAPIAINELGGKGSLNFVILRHDNIVDKVSVTARIDATGYSFTIPLSQHDFPSDVDAAVHPVPGGYVPLGIYNNYTDAELKIQEVARPYLAGPRLPKPKYLNQPGTLGKKLHSRAGVSPGLAEQRSRSSPARRNSGSVLCRRLRITDPMRRRSISQRRLPGSHSPPALRISRLRSCGQQTAIIAPSGLNSHRPTYAGRSASVRILTRRAISPSTPRRTPFQVEA